MMQFQSKKVRKIYQHFCYTFYSNYLGLRLIPYSADLPEIYYTGLLHLRPDLINFLLLGPAGQNLADLENKFNMNIINSACCA